MPQHFLFLQDEKYDLQNLERPANSLQVKNQSSATQDGKEVKYKPEEDSKPELMFAHPKEVTRQNCVKSSCCITNQWQLCSLGSWDWNQTDLGLNSVFTP